MPKGPPPGGGGPSGMVVRRRPTLPPRLRGSTIGAERLSFRVRNVTGRFPLAMAAVTRGTLVPPRAPARVGGGVGCGFRTAQWTRAPPWLWWVCVVSPRPVSTGQLHTLRCFHFRPINPLVWAGALPHQVGERPHLEASFPLRCFQRLSLPNVANQPCTWRYNWHTRGSSVPVLSY